ncbi:heterokaryon incompatibility protein-domain-containing protein [Cubamyces menziesii]|nr:heterokaryon incompatibility protein-domain-containing protein [Cubamyces menziesii]
MLSIPHVGAPHVLERRAKIWMDECAQGHEVCRRLGAMDSGDWLPTRLIDCSDPGRVRIIETSKLKNRDGARYVALSYVWGTGSQSHQTTNANLPTRTRIGIATETLPRTIRDAIYVTRTLGFRFLWLDSLCIIQDSAEDSDKHREVRSMARVYRHAYLTIDVATAASVEEGFLQDRPTRAPRDATFLPFICPASPGDGEVQTEARMGNVYLTTYANSEDYRESETARRGWCLQETLLSTRSLIFDREMLSIKCQRHSCPRHISRRWHKGDVGGLYDVIPIPGPGSATAVLPGSYECKTIHRHWQEIVENYSRRSLTYASDKLLACAAIAEVFAPHLGQTYLAGLWLHTLLLDLLWHIDDRFPNHPRPRGLPYRDAPSWSWASTNRPIAFFRQPLVGPLQPMVQVVDSSIALQDKSLHFGEVVPGAYLVLDTALLPCKWHRDVGRLEFQQVASQFTACGSDFRGRCYFDDDADIQDVFLVPLLSVYYDWKCGGGREVKGLLIASAHAESSMRQSAHCQDHSQVYQRVGVWEDGWAHARCVLLRDEDPEEGRPFFEAFVQMCQDIPKKKIVLV